MVLTGSCPCPGSWPRTHGAHLHLQAREDPTPTAAAVPSACCAMKDRLRERARVRRAALARENPDFAVRVARFAEQLPLSPKTVVAGYHPFNDEADPLELMKALAALGHPLALPLVRPGKALRFAEWAIGAPTRSNRFGILEPEPPGLALKPAAILVPLLAFDAEGHRLGYGGGYYDRALENSTALAIGIAYAGQEVEKLPRESHDRPLDLVVTETGARAFG